MTWYEILIILAACRTLSGVIAASVIRRKHGKTGCGCDCGGCSGCSGCASCKPENKDGPDNLKQHTQQSP